MILLEKAATNLVAAAKLAFTGADVSDVAVLVIPSDTSCTINMADSNFNEGFAQHLKILSNLGARRLPEGVAAVQIKTFADSLERGKKSKKTAKDYSSDIRRVLTAISSEFFDNKAVDKLDLSEITAEQTCVIESKLFENSLLAPATLDRLKQGWNSFCSFIGMECWKFTYTTNTIQEYKDDAVSNFDVLRMLDFCQQASKNAKSLAERTRWLRIEILIGLGWGSGLRSCEYANTKFDEVERTGRVTIRNSKHNGSRKVAIIKDTLEAIKELGKLLMDSDSLPPNGGIFEKPDGSHYCTSTFRRWLKKVAKGCGANSNLAKTHGLRHRFAKNFNDYAENDFMLADIMGHSSTSTTRNYARQTFENQRDAIQGANDKARKNALKEAKVAEKAKTCRAIVEGRKNRNYRE